MASPYLAKISPFAVEIDCGPPNDVQNCEREPVEFNTTYGSTIHYTCIEGFLFEEGVHQLSQQCDINGQWHPELPHCTGTGNVFDFSLQSQTRL